MRYRQFAVRLCSVFFFLLFMGGVGQASDYFLEPGDVLSINVYGYTEVSMDEVVIQPDGKVALPLVGGINTTDMTVAALTQLITQRLDQYLEKPLVTVNLVRRQAIKVSVLGEVNHPGFYGFERGRTVMDAISMASGWTKEAAKTKVFLFHRNQLQGVPQTINLLDFFTKNDFKQNQELADGDVVYLSSNHRVDIIRDVLPFIYPFYLLHHWEKTP